MLLDLWNSETLMHNFLNLYGLEKHQFVAVLKALFNDSKLDIISTFCEKTASRERRKIQLVRPSESGIKMNQNKKGKLI